MRVVHVPYAYHPDAVGGTEVYVAGLTRTLREFGIDATIAAPGTQNAEYEHDGIPVSRFAITPNLTDLGALYGTGDRVAAANFASWLDRHKPDVVHLHAFTSAVSLALVNEVKSRGILVVFTYHTPAVSCVRESLLRWGTDICDGYLDRQTCTACTLQRLGASRPVGALLAHVPVQAGRALERIGAAGGPWTALRMSELVERQHAALRSLFSTVDHVVAVCGWARDLLLLNGVPADKITLSRHGLDGHTRRGPPPPESRDHQLRVAYVGRLDPTKGAHILIDAVRKDPGLHVTLDIFGVVQGTSNEGYARELARQTAADPRITLRAPLPHADVIPSLATYDVVAVPSQCLETGPLVVLEAFAAGRPVLGSRLGGISELVEDGVNGMLVAPGSVDAWRDALARLGEDQHRLVDRLARGIQPVRRWADVATDMCATYALLARPAHAAPPSA